MEELKQETPITVKTADKAVSRRQYLVSRAIGIILGILPFAVIIYAFMYCLDDPFDTFDIGIGNLSLLFFLLHLITPVTLFVLVPWSRWMLLATLTFDMMFIIILPNSNDFLARYQPITLHTVLTQAPMQHDASILSITIPVYLLCAIILAHPGLGRLLVKLQRYHLTQTAMKGNTRQQVE